MHCKNINLKNCPKCNDIKEILYYKYMGNLESQETIDNDYKLYEDEKINVLFVQVKKNKNCNVELTQFNLLLGLNIPKYSILEGTHYPYLFCVSEKTDIYKIAKEYNYTVGFITKQTVLKSKFNSTHTAYWCCRGKHNYCLENLIY
jgi:hypothetical protein